MKKVISLVIFLACLVAFTVTDCRAEEKRPMFVHFIVLPKTLPDGGNAQATFTAFQEEMIALAGGFTELGDARGGSMHSEVVVPKENVAYLVAAKRDVSLQIKEAVKRLFGLNKAFILVWQGHLVR